MNEIENKIHTSSNKRFFHSNPLFLVFASSTKKKRKQKELRGGKKIKHKHPKFGTVLSNTENINFRQINITIQGYQGWAIYRHTAIIL